MLRELLLSLSFLLLVCASSRADEPAYRLVDPQLKLGQIASDPKESFLGIHLDPQGRLFVGGREALFIACTPRSPWSGPLLFPMPRLGVPRARTA